MTDPLPDGYPVEWQTDIILSDGSTARLRPILPSDRDLLAAFHNRQSRESIYFRFFRFRPELSDKELDYFTEVDYDARMAFVAQLGDELVAVARYETFESKERAGEKVAEVAFFVDDGHHGKGLATLMLEYLAAVARSHDYDGFTATVLPENVGMLRVFRRAGFEVSTRFSDGVVEVDLGIDVTAETQAVVSSRARRAQARSVARLLAPSSLAVVGASRQPGTPGHDLLKRLVDGGFAGEVVAVNPAAVGERIAGVEAVGSLADLDEAPDLAIVAVPAVVVPDVAAEAARLGVGGLVVVSAGFADAGPDGAAAERELVATARANGMRVVGPNSFGLVNTDPEVSLAALFLPVEVAPGSLAVVSESGPLGAALLDEVGHAGIGVSSFVGIGNRGDVSVNDLLAYWTEDERTDVVAAYLDTWGNPRNVVPVLRDLCRRKPVVTVAPADGDLAELLAQSGVILVDRVAELVAVADLLQRQPLPAGDRVAVVSNAASVARLAVNACRRGGLRVVVPDHPHTDPASATVGAVLLGDVDATSLADGLDAESQREALVATAVSDEVDAVLVALVPTPALEPRALGRLLDEVDRAVEKPLVASGLLDARQLGSPGLPVHRFPEDAAQTLARAATLARWRAATEVEEPDEDDAEAREELAAAVLALLGEDTTRTLDFVDDDSPALLGRFGLPTPSWRRVATADEAAAAASELGFPVVLKAGRTEGRRAVGEAGGAALDLRDRDDVAAAFERMAADLGPTFAPAIVQQMVPSGHQLSVCLLQDARAGSRLALGLGGLVGAPLGPLESIVLPASRLAIRSALTRLGWVEALLDGREAPTEGLVELCRSLARVGAASPDVARVEANPVVVTDDGVCALDVSVELRAWPRDPLAEVRHL